MGMRGAATTTGQTTNSTSLPLPPKIIYQQRPPATTPPTHSPHIQRPPACFLQNKTHLLKGDFAPAALHGPAHGGDARAEPHAEQDGEEDLFFGLLACWRVFECWCVWDLGGRRRSLVRRSFPPFPFPSSPLLACLLSYTYLVHQFLHHAQIGDVDGGGPHAEKDGGGGDEDSQEIGDDGIEDGGG